MHYTHPYLFLCAANSTGVKPSRFVRCSGPHPITTKSSQHKYGCPSLAAIWRTVFPSPSTWVRVVLWNWFYIVFLHQLKSLLCDMVFSHYHWCEIGLSNVRQQYDNFLSYTLCYYADLKHKQTSSAVGDGNWLILSTKLFCLMN